MRGRLEGARTAFDLFKALKEMMSFYGFDTFFAVRSARDSTRPLKERIVVTNFPPELVELLSELSTNLASPLFQELKFAVIPQFARLSDMDWPETAKAALQHMTENGFDTIVVLPVSVPGGLTGAIVFGGEREKASVTEMMELAYLANYATDAMQRIVLGVQTDNPLTEREIAVLQALSRGKAISEISRDIGIAPNTVTYHLRRAMATLGTRTRSGTVADALRLGFIN